MNKLLKTTLLSAFCLVILAGCGKKDETTDNNPQESANVGNILDDMGPESSDCPDNYEPVCTDGQITYKNACHAEKAGEDAWQPGEC